LGFDVWYYTGKEVLDPLGWERFKAFVSIRYRLSDGFILVVGGVIHYLLMKVLELGSGFFVSAIGPCIELNQEVDLFGIISLWELRCDYCSYEVTTMRKPSGSEM